MDKINNNALCALQKGDFDTAQLLLRINLKNNPSHLTYNNLGYFYVDNGMTLKNGKVVGASSIGMRYLKKASKLGVSYENSMAIGILSRYDKDYKAMVNAFEQALGCKEDYAACYNLGSTYVFVNKYEKAFDAFSKALEHSVDKNAMYASALALLHVSLKLNNKDVEHLFKHIEYVDAEKRIDDEIAAFYYLERYDLISSLCLEQLPDEYYELPIIAMILDTLIRLGHDEKLTRYMNIIEDIYELEEIMAIREMLNNTKLRKKIISKYNFKYGIEDRVCCYIECPNHCKE